MNEKQAMELATKLLTQYGDRGFDVSMANAAEYDLMREAFATLGRESGPDGKFFVVRVAPASPSASL